MIASRPNHTQAWCCVQAGHREQYGIPRALARVGALDRLVTDIWLPPGSPLARFTGGGAGRRLRDRFHPDLVSAVVDDRSWHALAWEIVARVRGQRGGDRVLWHNTWWAGVAADAIRRLDAGRITHVFSYCYEARAAFVAAERRGFATVLGQIDPGPVEDAKVRALVRLHGEYRTSFQPSSAAYYESWRDECARATHIVVNSEWSRRALVEAGIEPGKIVIVPLVYTSPVEAENLQRGYPAAFTSRRPLRVLFLGQLILRKGIAEVIAAARCLTGRPVEFMLVGNTDIAALESHFGMARILYHPRVARAECHAFYRTADVFLFPTHSDGFGLTQLEAQAWRLPLIASSCCAEVVCDGETGWRLPEVSAEAIVETIEEILGNPGELARRSARIVSSPFQLDDLGAALLRLGREESAT